MTDCFTMDCPESIETYLPGVLANLLLDGHALADEAILDVDHTEKRTSGFVLLPGAPVTRIVPKESILHLGLERFFADFTASTGLSVAFWSSRHFYRDGIRVPYTRLPRAQPPVLHVAPGRVAAILSALAHSADPDQTGATFHLAAERGSSVIVADVQAGSTIVPAQELAAELGLSAPAVDSFLSSLFEDIQEIGSGLRDFQVSLAAEPPTAHQRIAAVDLLKRTFS